MAIYYGDGSNSATGRTVQTVQFTYTTALSATSNDGWKSMLTGAYIQPKNADSKILVTVCLGRLSGPSNSVACRVLRDRGGVDITAIGVHTASSSYPPVSFMKYGQGPVNNDHADGQTFVWLDTHGDAAGDSCYYQLQCWGQNNGTMYINRTQNANDSNQPYAGRTATTFTLQEITV